MKEQDKITDKDLREAAERMNQALDRYEEKVRRVIGELQDDRDKAIRFQIEDAQDTVSKMMIK